MSFDQQSSWKGRGVSWSARNGDMAGNLEREGTLGKYQRARCIGQQGKSVVFECEVCGWKTEMPKASRKLRDAGVPCQRCTGLEAFFNPEE